MKTLILGLVVTLILTTFLFVLISGAVILEGAAWAGRRKTSRQG